MNSKTRGYQIKAVKREVGWAYPQLKWLNDEEAARASAERSDLLALLDGRIDYSYHRNKLHLGRLSPGCSCCGDGTWSCLFLNGLCTANCFFCPQDREMKQERPPAAESLLFIDPLDYAGYVRKLKIKGVSFSGGESLLEYKKLLSFVETLRNKLGTSVYLWMYSNGDLVDKDKLQGLKQAGLDEIRFNIAARGYKLKTVEMAGLFIETVSVEIPAIPEDLQTVKDLLAHMSASGVKHLNLHQLLATQFNYKALANRGYTFLHQPGLPSLESEIVALKLIQFAAEKNIGLPINYCSQAYKLRLQGRGHRVRAASAIVQPYEEMTEYGYLRRITIEAPGAMKKITGILKAAGCDTKRWREEQQGIIVHSSLIPYLTPEGYDFHLAYLEPRLTEPGAVNEVGKLKLDSGRVINVAASPVAEYKYLSAAAMFCLNKIYIDGEDYREAMRWFAANYDITAPEKIQRMAVEKAMLKEVEAWEQVPAGLSEIF